MTREELITRTSFVLDDKVDKGLQLYGIPSGEDNAYRISISNNLEIELIKVVANGVKTLLLNKEQYDIVDFSTADERKNKYYRYDLDNIPERMLRMSDVIGNHGIKNFDYHNHTVDELTSLILLVSDRNGTTFTVYKSISSVEKVLKSTRSVLARFGIGEDCLDEETKPMLRISPKFQIIFLDGPENDRHYIFLETSSIETHFKLNQVLMNEASKKITIIRNTNLVKDVSKIERYANTPAFCRKLVKVLNHSKVLSSNISKKRILEFIEGDDELCKLLKITGNQNCKFININSQKSAQKFLDLLNDEFVYSALTQQKYQAVDKDER